MVKTFSLTSLLLPFRCGRILAAKHKSNNLRKESSSGGVFGQLATWVIEHGGVVIGAAYVGTDVQHIVIDKISDIWRLQKSKYAPSSLKNPTIKQTLSFAESRWVLFSGTPCQVMSIKSKYGNMSKLILVEIACHGVPRIDSYRAFINDNGIENVDFRNKRIGWKNYEIKMQHKDGSVTYHNPMDVPYFRDYMTGETMQKRCFNCVAKYFRSGADFTLADFWGANEFVPEMDDDMGVSLVFLHTQKSQQLWSKVASLFVTRKVPLSNAIRYNSSVVRPAKSQPIFIEKTAKLKLFLLKKLYILYKDIL